MVAVVVPAPTRSPPPAAPIASAPPAVAVAHVVEVMPTGHHLTGPALHAQAVTVSSGGGGGGGGGGGDGGGGGGGGAGWGGNKSLATKLQVGTETKQGLGSHARTNVGTDHRRYSTRTYCRCSGASD